MNREKYTEITGDEAQSNFADLAAAYFESTRWKTDLAELLGITVEGVNGWFREGKRPPYYAFVALDALTDNKAMREAFLGLKRAAKYINNFT